MATCCETKTLQIRASVHFPIFTATLLLSRYRTVDTLFVCLRNANDKIEDFDTKQEELEHQIRLLRIAVGNNEIYEDKLMSLEFDLAFNEEVQRDVLQEALLENVKLLL